LCDGNVMKEFFKRRVSDPLLKLLRQGVTPAKLAWAVSIGIVIATVPVFGTSTILCLAAIWLLRLNPAAVLLTNQLAYPLQFLLYFPFLRSGEWLFDAQSLQLSVAQIFSLFQNNFWQAVNVMWWSTLYGLTVWILVAIPLTYFSFLIFRFIFTKSIRNFEGLSTEK
jgi:uncharacterized protein (DUF2062 family)